MNSPGNIAAEHAEHYDPEGGRIGMWLFLFAELLLFGALFIAYAVYLNMFRWDFQVGSRHLDKLFGAANTVILLTSSLTMALAIAALERAKKNLSLALQSLTCLMALGFLGIKAVEWGGKFRHGIYPGSEALLAYPEGEQVFYSLYFTMTGMHALHVIAGICAILYAMWRIRAGRIRPERSVWLVNTGLYWHLVDVIWIFLFPLFYLIG